MRHKSRTLTLGTISEGTLRADDLRAAYLDAASTLRLSRAERATVTRIENAERVDDDSDDSADLIDSDVEELIDVLDSHVPDFAYFGSQDGDGACFGVWISWDAITDAEHDGTLVRSTRDQSAQERAQASGAAYALDVSDHGNATLYRRAGRRWIEVWSVV